MLLAVRNKKQKRRMQIRKEGDKRKIILKRMAIR